MQYSTVECFSNFKNKINQFHIQQGLEICGLQECRPCRFYTNLCPFYLNFQDTHTYSQCNAVLHSEVFSNFQIKKHNFIYVSIARPQDRRHPGMQTSQIWGFELGLKKLIGLQCFRFLNLHLLCKCDKVKILILLKAYILTFKVHQ